MYTGTILKVIRKYQNRLILTDDDASGLLSFLTAVPARSTAALGYAMIDFVGQATGEEDEEP